MAGATLLIKGRLLPYDNDPIKKAQLDEWVPIDYVVDWFAQRVQKTGVINRVLVLKSETASGKSTLLPPELYKRFIRNAQEGLGIICTQPRIMTAIENVNDMLKYNLGIWRLGENIGWSTGANKLKPSNASLLSTTVGTLTEQLRTMTDEELCARYQFILIDETHERDLDTDLTIYMLKNFLLRVAHRLECPFVVLMSATFQPEGFLRYFGVSIDTNYIWCKGGDSRFTEKWDWNGGKIVHNYTRACMQVVKIIVEENPDDDPLQADILIFLPGKGEIDQAATELHKLNAELAAAHKHVFSVLKIDSDAVKEQNTDYRRVMNIPVLETTIRIGDAVFIPRRRVVLSTNVAETGLTLDNLKYSIDAGFNRETEFNPIYGMRSLLTKPAPRSRIIQRRGRVGRKFPGVFYPLYPDWIYSQIQEFQFPTILVADISSIMLDIICEQLRAKLKSGVRAEFVLADIDMLDIPSSDALAYAIEKAIMLGFLAMRAPLWTDKLEDFLEAQYEDAPLYSITKLGALARQMRVGSLEAARMILAAYYWDSAPMDLISIAAWLVADRSKLGTQIKWELVYKRGLSNILGVTHLVHKVRSLVCCEFIDGVIFISAIKNTISTTSPDKVISVLGEWCNTIGARFSVVLKLIEDRDNFTDSLIAIGFDMSTHRGLMHATLEEFSDAISRLKHCIYDGFRGNVATLIAETSADVKPKYTTSRGLVVKTPAIIKEQEHLRDEHHLGLNNIVPKYILYAECSLKYKRDTMMYEPTISIISMLDGFLTPDVSFIV